MTRRVKLYGLDGARERARQEFAAAVEALSPYGERAAILQSLARYVVEREN